MKMSKMFGLVALSLMLSASAFADYVTAKVGGPAKYLASCGGTVKVNNGGNDNQLNITFKDVQDCSYVILQDGRQYQMKQPQGERSGSYTILTASQLRPGSYTTSITLQSASGKHWDIIKVPFTVTGGYNPYGY